MTTEDKLLDPSLEMNAAEQQMAADAQRCLMASLDHSRAATITVESEGGENKIQVPPKTLRVIARVLGLLSQGKPVSLVPERQELSTVEAAAMLGVSRPFLIKELEAGKLAYRLVGTHRRIEFSDLVKYRESMRVRREEALQDMAEDEARLGLKY